MFFYKSVILIIIQVLTAVTFCFTQNIRGAQRIEKENLDFDGNSYAIIVGISHYPDLAPLQYADNDAFLFYNFLLTQQNIGLDSNNIRLFINEEATAAAIMTKGISWLQNTIKPSEGDRVYFYFAGHGDAVDASEAYFLAYDANPAGDKNNYAVSGTINIQVLKNRIRKLTNSGVEVIFIMDACRTDDIPGGADGIAGSYESILEQKNGELMMLSASPNQFSYEHKKFGNGHGLFTWHLVNGLAGKADQDGDQKVSLFELDNYVRLKVRNDSKEFYQIQTPVFCCSKDFEKTVSNPNEQFLTLINRKYPDGTDSFEHQLLASRSVHANYHFETQEIKDAYFTIKELLKTPNKESFKLADSVYAQITKVFEDKQIITLREFYTTKLIDQVQIAINSIMTGLNNIEGFDNCDYWEVHHKLLERAIEINENVRPEMKEEYKNRLTFLKINMWFDGQVALSSTYGPESNFITYRKDGEIIRDDSLQVLKENIEKCEKLIKNGYDNALVHYTMAILYDRLKMYDKSVEYASEAIKRAPNWPKPYNHIIKSYVENGEMDSAEHYALKRFDLDTSNFRFSDLAHYYYSNTNEKRKIRMIYEEQIRLGIPLSAWLWPVADQYLMDYYNNIDEPDSSLYYYRLRQKFHRFPYKSLITQNRLQEVIDTVQQRLNKGDTLVNALAALYYIYDKKHQNKKLAEQILNIAENYYPSNLEEFGIVREDWIPIWRFYISLGNLYMSLESTEAEKYFILAEKLKPSAWSSYEISAKKRLLVFYKKNNMYEKQLVLELEKYGENKSTVNAINIAQVYSNLKDTLNAKRYLEVAINMDPYWYSRMYHISKIYKEIGEFDLSEKYFQRAIEIGYSPKRKDDLNTVYGTVVYDCE